jgi:hypothetical protein
MSAIGIPAIPGSSSRVGHSVTARVMTAKVVMSLGMGARKGGARQGKKGDCLEEHVGWMMPSGCYKDVVFLNEVSWDQRQIFVVNKGDGKRCSRRSETWDTRLPGLKGIG